MGASKRQAPTTPYCLVSKRAKEERGTKFAAAAAELREQGMTNTPSTGNNTAPPPGKAVTPLGKQRNTTLPAFLPIPAPCLGGAAATHTGRGGA